jgi:hypothetical protein
LVPFPHLYKLKTQTSYQDCKEKRGVHIGSFLLVVFAETPEEKRGLHNGFFLLDVFGETRTRTARRKEECTSVPFFTCMCQTRRSCKDCKGTQKSQFENIKRNRQLKHNKENA